MMQNLVGLGLEGTTKQHLVSMLTRLEGWRAGGLEGWMDAEGWLDGLVTGWLN